MRWARTSDPTCGRGGHSEWCRQKEFFKGRWNEKGPSSSWWKKKVIKSPEILVPRNDVMKPQPRWRPWEKNSWDSCMRQPNSCQRYKGLSHSTKRLFAKCARNPLLITQGTCAQNDFITAWQGALFARRFHRNNVSFPFCTCHLFVTENTFLPSLGSILHVGATRNTKAPNCMTDRSRQTDTQWHDNRAWSKPSGLLLKPVYNKDRSCEKV